ncbi:hypothetical protein B0F90DRAFT_1667554 [Multifurca ochricompacta]|uniref:Uncharacterized protein n=1 Tax=Multifurca ochricompacta TaxID=376703 RepID=A0AAD4M7E9_9AGAM|nr:hypothetical protein B0F90DRAFT_1667554 [Multifurca ochricompacta]
MSATPFCPMVYSNCLPKIIRRYHHQHLPPPSDPAVFMLALRRGLRGANRPGFWRKLKSAGWRFLLKFDKYMEFEQPPRPAFPVAPPPTPCIPPWLPDIYITLAGHPEFEYSTPPPQVEGFLAVPERAVRARRTKGSPPSPRPLPTPPGPPPSYPVPGIPCFPWENCTSQQSSTEQPAFLESDWNTDDIAAALFYADISHVLLTPDSEDAGHQSVNKLPQWNLSNSPSDTASTDNASGSALSLGTIQSQEIKDLTADADFLSELGLDAHQFRKLLEDVDIGWDAEPARDQANT